MNIEELPDASLIEIAAARPKGITASILRRKKANMSDEHRLYDLLRALSTDMHNTSTRPCKTCRDLTEKLGWPFGCYERQERSSVAAALTPGDADEASTF